MESQFSALAPYIALASVAIAVLALVLAVRGDRRKSGVDIRSSFSVASAIWSKERWVSHVALENLKDRSITIYKIYLKVGYDLYIEVEDLTENPLTLGPYSVYQKKYDTIEFYSHGMRRVTGVLDDRKKRRRIVLATSQGRHNSKHGIMLEDPMLDTILKNHWTGVVRPERWSFKGRCYGSEAKFIITFVGNDGQEEIVPIYPKDYEIQKFSDFTLTKDSLGSKQTLECFLNEQRAAGTLSCSAVDVLDLEPFRNRLLKDYSKTIGMIHQGWFSHNILGRFLTIWENWRMNRKNKKLRAGKR